MADKDRVVYPGTVNLGTAFSGNKQNYTTGATRDSSVGKGRYDLISPYAEHRLAIRCEAGALNHGDRNWEKGFPISRAMDSARRHLSQYLAGNTDEDHLAGAMWNIMAAMQLEETHPEMQDIPSRMSVPDPSTNLYNDQGRYKND